MSNKIAQGLGARHEAPFGHEDQHLKADAPHLKPQGDAKLPRHEDLVKQSRASQAKGNVGVGHNDQAFNESMADQAHGVKVFETALRSTKVDSNEHESPLNKKGDR
jgi:hypothetical protein